MFNLLLYGATVLIWGSTWIVIDFQLGEVDPSVSLAYRYAIAAALSFGWCLLSGRSLRFRPRVHLYFMMLGMFLFGLNYLAVYQAQLYIDSALNAIGFATMVWINIINARLFFGTRATPRMYLGAMLGAVGILIIFLPQVQHVALSDRVLIGLSLSLLATLIASFGNVVSQSMRKKHSVPVMQTNAWGMLYGALLNTGIAVWRGKPFIYDSAPAYTWSLLYLSVIGTVVVFACYLTLLNRIGLAKAGYAAIMIPVVAVSISVVFEGLALTPSLIGGLILVLAGNVFILARTK
jgi:drug/metabolite transporter (DMT)-like permease